MPSASTTQGKQKGNWTAGKEGCMGDGEGDDEEMGMPKGLASSGANIPEYLKLIM